jgi:hypothetical protein
MPVPSGTIRSTVPKLLPTNSSRTVVLVSCAELKSSLVDDPAPPMTIRDGTTQ